MPTNYINEYEDPRWGNRWFGKGAIGRFFPGKQSPFPKPRPQDYGVNHPQDYAPFVDWSQVPQGVYEGDEQTSQALDFLGDWDYQNPPLDPEGNKLGPDLKPLPEGAVGFTPQGTPYYGDGLAGWAKGFWSRMTAGIDPNFQQEIPKGSGDPYQFDFTTGSYGGVPLTANPGDFFGNLGATEEGTPSPVTYVSRLVKEAGLGILDLFQLPAQAAERALVVGESVEDLGAGSPLPALKTVGTIEKPESLGWLPDFIPEVINALTNITPATLAYNSIRSLTAPPRRWEDVKETWENNYQASRIAYSAFGDEALKQEFVSRYKGGADPHLLALELQKPFNELVGQLVADPLNFVGFATKGLRATRQIGTLTQEFLEIAPDVENALNLADDVSDTTRAAKLAAFTDLKIADNAKVVQNLDNFAANRGWSALTTGGKRFWVSRRANELASYIAHNSDNLDDALETYRSMVLLASDNADEVATGLTAARHFVAPRALLGRAGSEFGIVLRKMLTNEDGVVDASRFLDELGKAKEEGIQAVIELANKKLGSSIDELFPTVLEQVQNPAKYAYLGKVNPLVETISRFDKLTKSKIYEPINRFYAGVYMGLSPGYAFRNAISNNLHILIDEGVGAWGKGTVFNPQKWLPRVEKWLGGHLPTAATSGFGPGAVKGLEVGQGGKWYQTFTALGEKLEQRAAMRVVGHAVERAMIGMLQPGRALPDIKPLLAAGFSKDAAAAMLSSVVDNFGDVRAAEKVMREMVAEGYVDVFRTLNWVDPADLADIRKFHGLYDDIADAARNAESLDDFRARMGGVMRDFEDEAKAAYTERVGFTENNELADELSAVAGENLATKGLGDDMGNVVNNRYIANSNVMNAYNSAFQELTNQAYNVTKGTDLFPQIQKNTEAVQALLSRTYGQVKQDSWRFTQEVVVPWSKKIHSMGSGDWAAIWRKIGIDGDPPPLLTKQQLLDTLWRQHFTSTQKVRWATHRDWQANTVETFILRLSAVVPIDPQSPILIVARKHLAHARLLDEAVMDGEYLTRVSHVINRAIQRGDAPGAIRALASHYGVATASAKGSPYDNHLLAIFQKHGGVESLDGLDLQRAHQILEARLQSKLGENYVPLVENLDEFLGAPSQSVRLDPSMFTPVEPIPGFGSPAANALDLPQGGRRLPGTKTDVSGTVYTPGPAVAAVGDIHGDATRLQGLLQDSGLVDQTGNWVGGNRTLVFTGDFTDRGVEGIAALETAMRLSQQATAAGGQVVNLTGNHDALLVAMSRLLQEVDTARLQPLLGGIDQEDLLEVLDVFKQVGFQGSKRDLEIINNFVGNGGRLEEALQVAGRPDLLDWLSQNPLGQIVDGDLYVHADNPFYNRFASLDEANQAAAQSLQTKEGAFQLFWDMTDRGWKESDVDKLLAQFGGRRVIHGHSQHAGAAATASFNGKAYNIDASLSSAYDSSDARGIVFQATSDEGVDLAQSAAQAAPPPLPSIPNAIIPPAHNPEVLPTMPRLIYEQLPGLQNLFKKIDGQAAQAWGRQVPIALDSQSEAALSKWLKQAETGVAEARLIASQAGNAARNFTLHDYPLKRNVDLALAYGYPYAFWHTREYMKAFQRMLQNPGVVSAYAKYRDTMETIHAGAPEWWRYNINSNELLGVDSENPLFFNLEQTLNPLYGLFGADFDDPVKRTGWFTRTLDDMGKFGPSTWTPFSVATALALYTQGEEEAAAHWAGRVIPQTGTLRSLGAIAGANIEVDPFVHLFSGGMDVRERRRVGRALGQLYQNGSITQEQMADAAYFQDDQRYPQAASIWNEATMAALDQRKWGQLSSFFLGVGFKARNVSDISIDQMYSDYYRLWEADAMLTPEEFKLQMSALRERYPFMDAVLLSRKSGPDRDRALAYNVLSRLPPGQATELTELLGINAAAIEQFYNDKGNLRNWQVADRDHFMAGIVNLGALFQLPDNATRLEWDAARSAYQRMLAQGEEQFGSDVWDRVDRYFTAKGSDQDSRDLADSVLENDPVIEAALDWRQRAIENTPLLMQYYGGLEWLENAWKGRMYSDAEQTFGDNIFDLEAGYFEAKDHEAALVEQYVALKEQNPEAAKDFYKNYLAKGVSPTDLFLEAYPQLPNFWDWKDNQRDVIAERLLTFREIIRPPREAELRPDLQNPGLLQQAALEQLAPQAERTWQQYQVSLSEPLQRTLMRYYSGAELPDAAIPQLEAVAARYGISIDELLFDVQRALYENALNNP